MKRGLKSLSLAGLVLLGTAGFYAWSGDGSAPAPEVLRSAVISQTSLEETVVATGVIRPVVGAEVNVGSRISGTVISLPVEVGDRVEVGQLLARLDDTALKAAADQVRAEVALARPQVTLAKAVLERRKRLTTDGLASEEDLDIARSDLAIAYAQLDESLARKRAAEINLSYAHITAPISGVVAAVSTREGETVAAGFSAPTFVTIVDLDRLEVLAYVDETDIGRVFVGQAASFEVDTYPGVPFTGVVTAIQPKAELRENVVNYVIRLELDAPDDDVADVIGADADRPEPQATRRPRLGESSEASGTRGVERQWHAVERSRLPAQPGAGKRDPSYTLRPEMTAHVRLVIAERDDALTAPRNALKRRNGRQYLLVQRGDAWVEQDVRTGWRSDSAVEILSGVQAGERVALNVK